MIGYYAHHHGSGHVNRAMAIAAELDDDVTILSSAPRPSTWHGGWVSLPLDHASPTIEPDARGALHFAPVGSAGLALRMAAVSKWLETYRPRAVVVDVSVEIASLVRLHGVRVVVIAQPGRRHDAPHELGYQLADAIIGCWPPSAHPLEAAPSTTERVEAVGGLSRFEVSTESRERSPEIVVFTGTGGRGESALTRVVAEARAALPHARWTTLHHANPNTVARALRTYAVVFTHCGQNAVAEVAAARVPAVFVPEQRPFEDQERLGLQLARMDVPALVTSPGEVIPWPSIIADLAADSGARWSTWVDGLAASRAARIIERVAAARSAA
jgi:hypothetical protein